MSNAILVPNGFSTAGWGSPRIRLWMIAALAGALLGVAMIVVEIPGAASDPDGNVPVISLMILAVAALITGCCYSFWSRRVRFLREVLEAAHPGSSVWKAMGYPMNADTLRRLAGDLRFISSADQTRTGLYAVFADDALTLWRRRGDALVVMASIPRDAIRFEGRDWQRPCFSFSVRDADGQRLPFALALSRGRFRRGIRDADAAHTVAAHWGRG